MQLRAPFTFPILLTLSCFVGCSASESASENGSGGSAAYDASTDRPLEARGDAEVGADSAVEAPTDANVDASIESGPDVMLESGPDAMLESGPDVMMESGLDATSDAAIDAPPEAGGDGASDALFEAQTDTGADVISDGAPDTASDVGGEAGADGAKDAQQDTQGEAQADGSAEASDASDGGALQDANTSEAQPGSDDVWVEIDYTNAYTPPSPGWAFSPTPGWGAAQWAQPGHTWPEAWDRFNNMVVENDPIGRTLTIGSSSDLQLMIGLEELVSYTSMSVRLEGRSKATSSSVDFDVYNPLNNCGVSGTMAQDWTVHVVDLDLGSCALVGAGVQAVRVSPTNGTVALVRMRVTLHGAKW